MANLNDKKKYHFIYKTTNLINGKFYIGMHSTSNMKDGYLGSGRRLRYSIRKYGAENFKIEYLEFFDSRKDLANREADLINEGLLNDPLCLNLKSGGIGGWSNAQQKKNSIKGILKIKWLVKNDKEWYEQWQLNKSKSLKGKQKWWIGKTHSEETKKKISESSVGRGVGEKNSQYGSRWITNGILNKKIKKYECIPDGWEYGRVHTNKAS